MFKKSLRSMNLFLHFFSKHVLQIKTSSFSVKVSLKEEKIQLARKKYVDARNIMIKYLNEYKTEKGDFYK